MPLFETLEARGIPCCLIRAQALTPVPGRQSDVRDCQWSQPLHSYGLLSAAFRPDAACVALLCACDAQIEQTVSVLKPRCEPAPTVPDPGEVLRPPRRKAHAHSKNAPAVNPRAHILRITGVDLVAVDGLSASLAQTILAA